jgi:putative DNA primase/helicase
MTHAEAKHSRTKAVIVGKDKLGQRANDNKAPVASDRTQLEVALHYAAKGFPVVPLRSTNGGVCTAGLDVCGACGRYPRTKRNINAMTDPDLIEKAWTKWPTAEIGIALGATAGLIAVTMPAKFWLCNPNDLPALEVKYPRTVTILDGGSAFQLYKTDPARTANRPYPTNYGFCHGTSFRGDGDFVVAPSCIQDGKSKRRFVAGCAPGEIETALAPRWIIDIIDRKATTAAAAGAKLK